MKASYLLTWSKKTHAIITLVVTVIFLCMVGCKDHNNTYTPKKKVKVTVGADPPEEFIESLEEQGIAYKDKTIIKKKEETQSSRENYYKTINEVENIYRSNLDYSKEYAKVKALEYAHNSRDISYAGICNNAMIIIGTNGIVKEITLSTPEQSSEGDESFSSIETTPKIFHESTRYH